MCVMYGVYTRNPVTNYACMQCILMFNGYSYYNSLSFLSELLLFKFMPQWQNEASALMYVSVYTARSVWLMVRQAVMKARMIHSEVTKVIKWAVIALKLRKFCTQAELVPGFLVYKYLTFLELPLINCLLSSFDCIDLIIKVQSWPLLFIIITKYQEELQAS